MSWNYRVAKKTLCGVEVFGMVEAYYNEDDEIWATSGFITIGNAGSFKDLFDTVMLLHSAVIINEHVLEEAILNLDTIKYAKQEVEEDNE